MFKYFASALCSAIMVTGAAPVAKAVTDFNQVIEPIRLHQDMDQWLDFIKNTHPEMSYTVKDPEQFFKNVESIKNNITKPITVAEFWKRITVLNEQLSDAHMGIHPVATADVVKNHLNGGGKLFPFEVVFQDGKLLVKSGLGSTVSNLKGYAVTKINGMAINDVMKSLLSRTHGDNEHHRKAILEKAFAITYWLMFGEQDEFTVSLEKGDIKIREVKIEGSRDTPLYVTASTVFEETYNFEILDQKTALLTLDAFYWPEEKKFLDFMQKAFTDIKDKNISHVILDIRKNGGGNDSMWMKGIMSYIADRPYHWGSNYKKKILAKYADEDEVVGDVVTGRIKTLMPDNNDNPLKFEGEVTVLIGAYTYSSSILFANTLQDYGFATLMGERTGGKSGQSGSAQTFEFPHSGLKARAPRFYLERPKGGGNLLPVIPDVEIKDDKLDPRYLVNKASEYHKYQ